MFHAKLLELESELLAKQESERALDQLMPECSILLDEIENEIGLRLADKAFNDWKGWLTFKRSKDSLIICRGRAFSIGGILPQWRAGFDVVNGADAISEYQRHFDVSTPQELDHLRVNFGVGATTRVFLWYGENIAAYRLIFQADMSEEPDKALHEAIVEACIWILTKPKEMTLPEFLGPQGLVVNGSQD